MFVFFLVSAIFSDIMTTKLRGRSTLTSRKKTSFNLNKLYHCMTPRPQIAANIYSTGDMIVFCLEHYNNTY